MADITRWLKVRTSIHDCPKVAAIAAETRLNPSDVVGRLVWLWSFYREHGKENVIPMESFSSINKKTHIKKKNFCEAVEKVGWISEKSDGVLLVNYDETYGEIATNRAKNRERQRKHRKPVTEMSHDENETCHTNVTLDKNRIEENRIEENRTTRRATFSLPENIPSEVQTSADVWLESRRVDHGGMHPSQWRATISRLQSAFGNDWGSWIAAMDTAATGGWKNIGPAIAEVQKHAGKTPSDRPPPATKLIGYIEELWPQHKHSPTTLKNFDTELMAFGPFDVKWALHKHQSTSKYPSPTLSEILTLVREKSGYHGPREAFDRRVAEQRNGVDHTSQRLTA